MGRGPHPADAQLFASARHPALRTAVHELAWLLSRGYAEVSALELVGNRHDLRQRQRIAVRRSACTDAQRDDRRRRRLALEEIRGRPVAIDGFNALIITESLLSGGVVLRGRDGALRDMASVHGRYRTVEATARALELLRDALVAAAPSSVRWYLDRPVSNSGRLARLLLELAPPDLPWDVELPVDPDRVLVGRPDVIATADATILDGAGPWLDLPAAVRDRDAIEAWIVDLEVA